MTVCSIEFLLALLLLAGVFFFLPRGRSRQLLLCACNLGFLASLVPNVPTWVALGAFLLSGYAVARILLAKPSGRILAAYLVLLIGAFIFLKKYEFLYFVLPAWMLAHPLGIVGLSYMLFRQIHFLVDVMQQQIPAPSLWAYLNYQLNFFAVLSGPIQRFQDFHKYWTHPEPLLADKTEILFAYLRVLLGMLKIALIAEACLYLYNDCAAVLAASPIRPGISKARVFGRFAMLYYAYPAYIYFNFSGYCDVVIGGASLLGMDLPENFNRPYLARNMIDYWNRWHRSLSLWIRDYIFTPMYKAIAERWPRSAPSLAFLCFFVALFLAGIWHGSTLNWVVFGLLNGAGVSAAKLWENRIVKRRGRAGLRQYMQSRRVRVVAILANLHFACFTILFFPADLDRCVRILRNVISAIA